MLYIYHAGLKVGDLYTGQLSAFNIDAIMYNPNDSANCIVGYPIICIIHSLSNSDEKL